MRIGTLVAGVLAMAAGFGLATIVIGWPVLVVGGPIVFGGAVVVLVTWLTGMHQRHDRELRYAHADLDDRWSAWEREHRALVSSNDEDTLDSDITWVGTASDDLPGGDDDGGASGQESNDSPPSDSPSSGSASDSSSSSDSPSSSSASSSSD